MSNTRSGRMGLSGRNWVVLLLFFVAVFVNRISEQYFIVGFFGLLLPFAMNAIVDRLRDRTLQAEPAWRLHIFAAVWLAVTTLLNWRADYDWTLKFWYVLVCWLYLGFMPRETDGDELRRELFSVGMLIVIGLLPLFLIALASVFTGRVMHVPFIDNAIGIQKARRVGGHILILQHHNVDARFAAFCVLFSIYGIVTHRHWALRAFLGFDVVISLMVLAHTQSRSSGIGLATALGALVFRAVFLRLSGKRWRVVAAGLAMALMFFALLNGVNTVYKTDVRISRALRAGQKTGTAAAQPKNARKILSHADKSGQFGIFSDGRDKIWLDTLEYLKDHPRYLLTGIGGSGKASYALVTEAHERIDQYTGYHNSYLSALAIGGVPLLLAMLAYLCMMVPPCLRVFLSPADERNKGLFIAPAFVLMLVLVAIPEEIILVRAGYANLLFYFMCGIVCQADRLSGPSK